MSKHVVAQLQTQFRDAILVTEEFRGDDTVVVRRERIVDICRWLKETPGLEFNFMMDLCGVDYPERTERVDYIGGAAPVPPTSCDARPGEARSSHAPERFDVVYHLYSLKTGKRIRLKVRVSADDPVVPSVIGVWIGADWFERECYDLFGIHFTGHPHLRRLLTYEEFKGHALRKDYPRNKRQKIPTPDSLMN